MRGSRLYHQRQMGEGVTFKTAKECAAARDKKAAGAMWGSGRKWRERQVQCSACKRWCYQSERCNLFTTISHPTVTGDHG